MMMKKLFFALLTVATGILVSCTTLTAAQHVALKKAVQDSLRTKHYKIDINMMYPQRGGAENVSSNWSLEVKGDTMVSYLPYIGVADFVPFGGGDGMNFKERIEKYSSTKNAKGATIVSMIVKHEEERMEFTVEVQPEGMTQIDVLFRNRDRIGYGGTLDADYE